jgi:hypothetical protein
MAQLPQITSALLRVSHCLHGIITLQVGRRVKGQYDNLGLACCCKKALGLAGRRAHGGPTMCTALPEILGHAEKRMSSTELPRTQNKLSGKYEECEGAPNRRVDAVRGIPYISPDYCNCRKLDCKHRLGHGQGS